MQARCSPAVCMGCDNVSYYVPCLWEWNPIFVCILSVDVGMGGIFVSIMCWICIRIQSMYMRNLCQCNNLHVCIESLLVGLESMCVCVFFYFFAYL